MPPRRHHGRRVASSHQTPKTTGAAADWKEEKSTSLNEGYTGDTNIPKSQAVEDDQSFSSQFDSGDASTPSNKVGSENVATANSRFPQMSQNEAAVNEEPASKPAQIDISSEAAPTHTENATITTEAAPTPEQIKAEVAVGEKADLRGFEDVVPQPLDESAVVQIQNPNDPAPMKHVEGQQDKSNIASESVTGVPDSHGMSQEESLVMGRAADTSEPKEGETPRSGPDTQLLNVKPADTRTGEEGAGKEVSGAVSKDVPDSPSGVPSSEQQEHSDFVASEMKSAAREKSTDLPQSGQHDAHVTGDQPSTKDIDTASGEAAIRPEETANNQSSSEEREKSISLISESLSRDLTLVREEKAKALEESLSLRAKVEELEKQLKLAKEEAATVKEELLTESEAKGRLESTLTLAREEADAARQEAEAARKEQIRFEADAAQANEEASAAKLELTKALGEQEKLQESLTAASQEAAAAKQELTASLEAQEKSERSLISANEKAEATAQELAAAREAQEKLLSELEKLKAEQAAKSAAESELQKKYAELAEAVTQDKEMIEPLQVQLKAAQARYEDLEQEASPKIQRLKQVEEEHASAAALKAELTAQLEQKAEALRQLEKVTEDLQSKFASQRAENEARVLELEKVNSELQTKLSAAESEVLVLRRSNEENAHVLGQKVAEITEAQQALDATERKYQALEESMRAEVDQMKKREADFEKLRYELEERCRNASESSSLNAAKLKEALEQIDELRGALSAQTLKVSQLKEEHETTVNASLRRVRSVEEELTSKLEELTSLRHQYETVSNHGRELEARLHDLQSRSANTEATIRRQEEEIKTLSQDMSALESTHKQVLEESRQKDSTIVEKNREAEVLQGKLQETSRRVKELEENLNVLQEELKSAEEQLLAADKLQSRLTEMDSLVKESEELQKRLSAATGALHNAEAEIEGRMGTEERLRSELNEWKEKNELLVQLLDERRRRNLLQRIFNIE